MSVRIAATRRKGTVLSLGDDKLKIAWDGSVSAAGKIPVLRRLFASVIEEYPYNPSMSKGLKFQKGMRVAETNDRRIIPDVDIREAMIRDGYI